MSEQKPFSVYEFDFNIMLLISFVGIFIKVMFENTALKNSNVGTASASIIGYSLVFISILSLLFVQIALAKGDSFDESFFPFLSKILFSSMPAILMLMIAGWMLYLHFKYYDRINDSKLTDEYYTASFISSILQVLQLVVLFKYFSGSVKNVSSEDNSFNGALESNITSLTYLLTITNIMFIGIINIILEFFATDG
tara:strand:+ start:1485 stop:2072 length:588 start_codon:yes stop_codon:yes gene_type:complete